MALIVGILLGAVVALPLVPLLPVTDPPFGRAATGFAAVVAALGARGRLR